MTISRTIKINRVLAVIVILLTMASTLAAQEVNTGSTTPSAKFDDSALQRIMPTRYGGHSRQWREAEVAEQSAPISNDIHQDSLHLPRINRYGQPEAIARYPMYFSGWNSWTLHRGLNVQLGTSVFAQFGKGAHHGAGFQQDIALMYAMPVNDKLSIAVGGYLNNVNFAGDNWRDAGVQAVMGYRFNEHWGLTSTDRRL